ncbi:predicted protein [Arabidopsis lyrata subsp. lyrata]|uniref:Predicted protein n=1 Tax=Arabidopsis lyrata subsp. lyrata TaxID=81972 RepID=D7LP15_ARALL|nr:predicted protein [Arabidopsis lyrata subsp. lyrata]
MRAKIAETNAIEIIIKIAAGNGVGQILVGKVKCTKIPDYSFISLHMDHSNVRPPAVVFGDDKWGLRFWLENGVLRFVILAENMVLQFWRENLVFGILAQNYDFAVLTGNCDFAASARKRGVAILTGKRVLQFQRKTVIFAVLAENCDFTFLTGKRGFAILAGNRGFAILAGKCDFVI